MPPLTQEVINGNLDKIVPENIYNDTVLPLLQELLAKPGFDPAVKFDFDKHIIFNPATDYEKYKPVMLPEIDIDHPDAISDMAFTLAFPLYSEEAVDTMRYEIFQKDIFRNHSRMANLTKFKGMDVQIAGQIGDTPFTKDAITHPKVMEIFNKLAGLELVYMMPYEVGSINFGIKPVKQVEDEKNNKEYYLAQNAQAFDENSDFVRGWHHDSNSFSLITMLSDTKDMIGGETALKTGDGRILKINNYQKGWASLVHAHCLNHIALKPYCSIERITAVTALRAKDPLHMDPTVLTTIKPSVLHRSLYNEYYPEWMDYRLEIMLEKLKWLREKVQKDKKKGKDFNQIEMINYLEDLSNYTKATWREFEVVDEGKYYQPEKKKFILNWRDVEGSEMSQKIMKFDL
ncbi:uncharacterized protein ASCRUDRAFT_30935 [Ascoidea rubescens DSM 1968]|uniref:Fe2OG dioxygenase domain-containing protein n=1 Tax=Ascoidea rubescens DSM 1968 TaxID=1344418 RepID=A0A1D2VRH2_9ASCO|nr:hypothetical protein ASCRUDRAFT_30935 [Ascoidea rubescens DSM 1968]ODV64212.1 hypothetical protein ASCRUDRAFT_30935 [Ascoidea rubescens DSM 1968]